MCCYLHHPEVTAGMFEAELPEEHTKFHPQQAKAKYDRDEAKSTCLDTALCEWRKQEWAQKFPDRQTSLWLGDWIVLPDSIIDDIIYLAHTNKLTSSESFVQLLDWDEHELYAPQLLPIVRKVFPPPAPPAPAPMPNFPENAHVMASSTSIIHATVGANSTISVSMASTSAAAAKTSTCKQSECSNCQETSHNSMLNSS